MPNKIDDTTFMDTNCGKEATLKDILLSILLVNVKERRPHRNECLIYKQKKGVLTLIRAKYRFLAALFGGVEKTSNRLSHNLIG